MTEKMEAFNPKVELEKSAQAKAGRNARITELRAKITQAEAETKKDFKHIDLLSLANEAEQRIIVLLNFLVVYPNDEEKQKILKSEKEEQKVVLSTLEAHCP